MADKKESSAADPLDSEAAVLVAQMEKMVDNLRLITDEIGPVLQELRDKIR